MEIWGVDDTMNAHAHEIAEAGFICLVPDLFWRLEPGGKMSFLMCRRTGIDGAVAYYAIYMELNIREAPNPLVARHRYADADHAFARHGGASYSEQEAVQALARSTEFFEKYLNI